MTDHELIAALLQCSSLNDWEQEAFESMKEWLDGHKCRGLSDRQREIAKATALSKGVYVEASQNLFSSGKVPRGIAGPKTRGENFAESVLRNKPARPPTRST